MVSSSVSQIILRFGSVVLSEWFLDKQNGIDKIISPTILLSDSPLIARTSTLLPRGYYRFLLIIHTLCPFIVNISI